MDTDRARTRDMDTGSDTDTDIHTDTGMATDMDMDRERDMDTNSDTNRATDTDEIAQLAVRSDFLQELGYIPGIYLCYGLVDCDNNGDKMTWTETGTGPCIWTQTETETVTWIGPRAQIGTRTQTRTDMR
jgi:hypothetical protein